MSFTENGGGNDLVMPVAPMGNGNGWGNGFGGDGWWVILFLFALMGNGGWGGFGGFGGGAQLGYDFPWILQGQQNTDNNVSNGFRDQMINSGVNSIRDGIHDVQTQLCNSTGNIQMALANGFAGVEQGANTRQMANMQQAFDLQSQMANCCCENRLATCQLNNTVQSEGSATRFADANNTRDIIQSQTQGTQAILDKLCQLELDGVKAQVEAKNDRISELQTQLNMATLRESQTAQNAFIAQGLNNEVDQLYNRLSSCPVPTTPVYGRTPIFTCNNNGCGCGSGQF